MVYRVTVNPQDLSVLLIPLPRYPGDQDLDHVQGRMALVARSTQNRERRSRLSRVRRGNRGQAGRGIVWTCNENERVTICVSILHALT